MIYPEVCFGSLILCEALLIPYSTLESQIDFHSPGPPKPRQRRTFTRLPTQIEREVNNYPEPIERTLNETSETCIGKEKVLLRSKSMHT